MAHLKEHHPELYTEAISLQKPSKDGKKKNMTKPAEAAGMPKQPTIIDIVLRNTI